MVKQIYSANIRKIFQNKKTIEDAFKIKITKKDEIIEIEGNPENEFIAVEAIEAINLGFPVSEATILKQDGFAFDKILIKSISRRRNLSQVRGRIIGVERKALNNIEYLTECAIVLHDNTLGVIGRAENVKKAVYALKKLIGGSKHANVYRYLEDEKAMEKEEI